jgi:hypothetical protein
MLDTEETLFWLISSFMLAMCFDVTIRERYIVSNYRLNDRLPNSLFSWGVKKKEEVRSLQQARMPGGYLY